MVSIGENGRHIETRYCQCSICRGDGGLTGASQSPQFSLTPTGLAKNTLTYIVDPPLVLPQIEC